MTFHREPIVAIATAPGRGAIGIVRASGTGLQPLAEALCGRPLPPRTAVYGPLRAADGQAIDHGLALFFPAPHSYTGEDVLELQGHGGPVVLRMLLARCLEAGAALGVRLARPGEFTERAFLNGRLDLAQAEAVADLIDASTEAAARGAARALGGALSQAVASLREELIALRVQIEAGLDFPEEELDVLQEAAAATRLQALREQLASLLARTRQGVLLREGLQVVIAGAPNAGKSSLLNALAGRESAIVTPIAGTTRDLVREDIQIDGIPLHVIDTAGLRASTDPVERIGIARAWDAIAKADAVLLVHDLSRREMSEFIAFRAELMRRMDAIVPAGVPRVEVWNKSDLCPNVQPPDDGLVISARTGAGLDALRRRLLALAGWQAMPEGVFMARERHLQALAAVNTALERAAVHLQVPWPPLELLAEELRLAQTALNRITGEFGADELLGEIFSRFCIGK